MASRVAICLCFILGLASASSVCDSEPSSGSRSCLLQVSKHKESDVPSRGSVLVKEYTHQTPPTKPHICVIARACGADTDCAPGLHRDPPGPQGSTPDQIVRGFLATMSAQTYPNFEVHLINGQGGSDIYTQLVPSLNDSRIVNGPNFPTLFERNTWGYDATNYALEELMKAPQAPCDYFLFTNADNVYGRYFLEAGLPGMTQGLDLVGFNFVTRYVQMVEKPGEETQYIPAHTPMLDPAFAIKHMDLGAALVSAQVFAAGIRFNTMLPHDKQCDADFIMFDEIMHREGHTGSAIMPELQFIHQ